MSTSFYKYLFIVKIPKPKKHWNKVLKARSTSKKICFPGLVSAKFKFNTSKRKRYMRIKSKSWRLKCISSYFSWIIFHVVQHASSPLIFPRFLFANNILKWFLLILVLCLMNKKKNCLFVETRQKTNEAFISFRQ